MGKFKRGFSVILTVVAGIMAIVAAILYRSVPYQHTLVYYMLIAAAVLACVRYLLAGFMPRLSAYFPICICALLASAAVWGTNKMVNQLGYVVAGLDPLSSIMTWIYFMGFTVVGLLLTLLASFMSVSLEKK